MLAGKNILSIFFVKLFYVAGFFLYPLKTSENLFQEPKKETSGVKYVNNPCCSHNKPAFTYSKLTIGTIEKCMKYVNNVFNVNSAHISHHVLLFLLTLNM